MTTTTTTTMTTIRTLVADATAAADRLAATADRLDALVAARPRPAFDDALAARLAEAADIAAARAARRCEIVADLRTLPIDTSVDPWATPVLADLREGFGSLAYSVICLVTDDTAAAAEAAAIAGAARRPLDVCRVIDRLANLIDVSDRAGADGILADLADDLTDIAIAAVARAEADHYARDLDDTLAEESGQIAAYCADVAGYIGRPLF